MSELAVDLEAALWWEIFRANVSAARANHVLRDASTADPLIPTDRLEFLASATTTQYITLGRQPTGKSGSGGPSPPAAASGPKVGKEERPPPHSPAFGDSRLNPKSGKLQWYVGICSTPECGKEAWAGFDPSDYGLEGPSDLKTPASCSSCYVKSQRRKA